MRTAFQRLLEDTAKARKWMLVPELAAKSPGKLIRPDGTLRDQNGLPRGYWEAKDTHDDLDQEIGVAVGDPLYVNVTVNTPAAELDFHLKPGSPASGLGTNGRDAGSIAAEPVAIDKWGVYE